MPEAHNYAELWDWRRRTTALYAAVRAADGGEAAWLTWRERRDAMFRSHPQTPIDAPSAFTGLAYFRYDPALRFKVSLKPVGGPTHPASAGADGEMRLEPFAVTEGLLASLGHELTVYWVAGYGGGAFLPFADATSGRETYGGGRYLLDTIKGADLGADEQGRTVLDFNYAYNPSCSYSSRYICPLAPPGNRLPTAVRGGEMYQPA